jgi:hypothetical protein
MFYKENESISVDVEMNQSTSKHVELDVRALDMVEKDVSTGFIEEVV